MAYASMKYMLNTNEMIVDDVDLPFVLVMKNSFDSQLCRLADGFASTRLLACI